MGKDHPDTLTSVNNLAFLYESQGLYGQAEPLFKRALQGSERVLGKDHPDTLTSVNNLAFLYERQGLYGQAEPLYKRALQGRERVLGKDHPDTLTSVNNLAGLYSRQGLYSQAEPLYKRALQGRERVLGKDHPDTLTSVNNLAFLYERQGLYGQAEPLYKRALQGNERVLGKDHPDTLASVNNLAGLYSRQGLYGQAEPLYKRALQGNEQVLGKDHPDTLTSVNNLAFLYESQGLYGQAEPLYKRALQGRERVLGKDHPDTLTSVNNLAGLYESQGLYGQAEPLYKRALQGRERVLGKDHPDTLTSVNNLAGLYESQGLYSQAEPLYKRALQGRERVLGKDHPDTLTSVNNLAGLYSRQGLYGQAEPLYKRALQGNEQVLGKDHPDTLTSVNNLAGLYSRQGLYGQAEPLYKRALQGNERVLGKDHPDTLTSVNNLAFLYESQGLYGQAEPLFKRALQGRERVLGKDHPETLRSVNNLASLYSRQGLYGQAEPLFKRALQGRERVLGKDHPDTLTSVNNLAGLYESQGLYGQAEPLYKRALQGRERVLGKDHPETLLSVNNLAFLYSRQGLYGQAEPLYKRALEGSKRVLGNDHPETLLSVNNLAFLYLRQGLYGQAEPLFKRALEGRERVLGNDHPDTLLSVNNLAGLYENQGLYGQAEPLYKRALEGSERVLGASHPHTLSIQLSYCVLLVNLEKNTNAFEILKQLEPRLFTYAAIQLQTTARQRVRRQFLLTQSTFQDVVFTLAAQHPSTAFSRYAAGVLLRWKRLQGDEDAYLARLVRTSDSPSIQALGQGVIELRSELSRLLNSPTPDADSIHLTLETLEARELELSEHSRRYKQHLTSRGVRADDVRSHLPARSALIEFKFYNPLNFQTRQWGQAHVAALVLPREPVDRDGLQLVDLGPASDIAKLWVDLRHGFEQKQHYQPFWHVNLGPTSDSFSLLASYHRKWERDTPQQFYQQLFGKLAPHLKPFDTLYIAPDGFLHLVALSRLVLPDDRYWFEHQEIRQIHTGRDLIPSPSFTRPEGLVAFGGMDYDRHGTQKSASVRQPETIVTAAADTRAMGRYLAKHITFGPLDHSGPEASEIAASFWDYAGSQPAVFRGPEATEAQLKSLQTPPRVLHLATHGFYLPREGVASERPMALSGLALAGANQGMQGELSPRGEDGILYALEAQNLNLEGTELIVLSACDTAKGTIDYADGVYGLTRAFRIAGARNVLMTLWPVGDASARAFMQTFYREWFGQGMEDAALALTKTREAFLKHRNMAWRDSQVWAPFVLVESR